MMRWLIGLFTVALLTACSAPVKRSTTAAPAAASGAYYSTDGPPERLPADLDRIPDAVPRVEPLHRFANRPYTVFGVEYSPMTRLQPVTQRGMASWYGRKFHGQKTAIGETYDMFAMTAAHPTFPLPSYARVTHTGNGRSVIVRVNDRGPFLHGRVIDLSYAAAHRLGLAQTGSAEVLVELLVAPFAGSERPAHDSLPPSEPVALAAEVPTRPQAPPLAQERFFVQLGAFGNFANAQAFQQRMQSELASTILVRQHEGLFRVQLGPFALREEAEAARREAQTRLGVAQLPILSSRSQP